MNCQTPPSPAAVRSLLLADLAPTIRGRLRLSQHDRMLYATDASIYQIEPLAIVHPADTAEIPRIAAFCNRHHIPLLPRGGGTSLPGQCVNRAVVVDYSPTCRKLLSADGSQCVVEPGITVDELNRQLASTGYFFAPDPATSAQCAIGGCIGNNAAGARSIRYGRTSENILSLRVALADGSVITLGAGAEKTDILACDLAGKVAVICRRYAQQIRERFPKTSRRNAGYALDSILAQLDGGIGDEDLDLTPLMCGSEGTLAFTMQATLTLHPIAKAKGLAIVSFSTLEDAISAVPVCLTTTCTAVELIDDVVLEAARGNPECRRYMDLLPDIAGNPPAAVLYVEYQEGSAAAVQERFASLGRFLGTAPTICYTDTGALLRAWALRKAGEPLLHGMPGHRKPVTCVEDNAVPVENLYRFVEGFKQIVARHGTRAAYWAHASVGVLHVRPMLNLHDEQDREHLRGIAQEVAAWARECGGVMSGEHGDGRIRGPLLRAYFGDDLMRAFAEVKAVFDPQGILNPGNITQPGDIASITQHLRILPDERPLKYADVETYYQYDKHEGLGGAAELCNGAGVCRKTAGGTMCPSYRATLDERHATRGRGNALRLAISGQLTPDGKTPATPATPAAPNWNDPDTLETLHLCLSCKACKSECPANVDIAQLKAEYLAQSYKSAGRVPLAVRVFGHVRALNRLGALAPGLANFVLKQRFVRQTMQAVLKIDVRRSLPRYAVSLHRQLPSKITAGKSSRVRARVVLFPDCFITYNEPHIGIAAVEVLEKLGYEVILPKTGCCGRSLISTGLLADAIVAADAVLRQLQPYLDDPSVAAILVAEPSCLSAFKDDYLELKCRTPIEVRRKLAAKSFLIEQFIEDQWDQHPQRPALPDLATIPPVLLHAHCHQKSLWTAQTSAKLLRRLCGDKLSVLDTGCCGMAGAFGFTSDRYELSMQIGDLSLLPMVRNAPAGAIIVAPGTSCRHQIHDGATRDAIHPMELVRDLLASVTVAK